MKSENLLQNVRKLLKIRSEDDKKPLKSCFEVFELQPLFDKIIKTLEQVYPSKNILITQMGLKNAKVQADSLLEDIFSNLLDNAIKFNTRKNVKVDILITPFTDPKDNNQWIKVEIKDYGRGIPDSRKKEVFRRFSRHGGRSTVSGSGLGLSIVQGIVNRLGGKIWIEDTVEGDYHKGARFILLLKASS